MEKKAGYFGKLWRVLSEFKEQGRQIPIVLLENVPAIINRGLGTVLGALSQIGYNAEWFTIRACDFGAPHKRERWFCICYVTNPHKGRKKCPIQTGGRNLLYDSKESPYPRCKYAKVSIEGKHPSIQKFGSYGETGNFWKKRTIESPICSLDDGVPNRVARLKALGNAIVPQCSHWIGKRMIETGLLRDILCY